MDATEFGLRPVAPHELRGGEPDVNARLLRDLISGKDTSARRDVVLLNAAAALASETGDFRAALEEAKTSLDSGAAMAKLDGLVTLSQQLAQAQAA
jgi:anthranilate phosphoribosyltransferase